ncbi:MAG: hypothetical protein WC069_03150 [Candidatus Shapirobacteria bacterium]
MTIELHRGKEIIYTVTEGNHLYGRHNGAAVDLLAGGFGEGATRVTLSKFPLTLTKENGLQPGDVMVLDDSTIVIAR